MTEKEKRLNEAISRLHILKINDEAEEKLKKGELVMLLDGSHKFVDLDATAKMVVEKVERKETFPYHVIKSNTYNGTIYTVLYVSFNEKEWASERPEYDYVSCYSYNLNHPDDEDSNGFGDIYYKKNDDGTILVE